MHIICDHPTYIPMLYIVYMVDVIPTVQSIYVILIIITPVY